MRFIVFILLFCIFVYGEIQKVLIAPTSPITIPPIDDPKLKDFSFSTKNATVAPFYISKYEITKQQYFKAINKELEDPESEDEPMTQVDFDQAMQVCRYYKGRLPTELEWIVAAGVKLHSSKCYEFLNKTQFYPYATAFFPLRQKSEIVQCFLKEDDEIEAEVIGSELVEVEYSYENLNGVYGMLGNVWEWVDETKEYFHQTYKIIKGGSYANANESKLFDVRISNPLRPTTKMINVGFRCVWDKQ